MAKKIRRTVKLSPAQLVQPTAGAPAMGRPSAPAAAPARPMVETEDLEEEYRYVIADLKRIGVIALVMLVVLIVLALLLT